MPLENSRHNIQCQYCLCSGLHWRNVAYMDKIKGRATTGWRLFTPGGNMHECLTLEEWLARKKQAKLEVS